MGLCFRKWILFPANFLFAGTFFDFSAHRPIFIFRNKVITLSKTLHPVHQRIMVDIVCHIFFHLLRDRTVLCQLLKDGLLEFFHGHLFVRFVRYRNRYFSAGQLQLFLLPAVRLLILLSPAVRLLVLLSPAVQLLVLLPPAVQPASP